MSKITPNKLTDDIPKYRKKSTTKGKPRSKHKHEYIPAIGRHYNKNMGGWTHYEPLAICKICGYSGHYKEAWPEYDFTKNNAKEIWESGEYPRYEENEFLDKFPTLIEED